MTHFFQKLLRDTHKFSEEQLRNSPDTLRQAAIVTGGINNKHKKNERRRKINGCS